MASLFRKTQTVVAEDETQATLAMPGVADIVEMREETWPEIITGWARSLLGFLLVAVILLAVLYTILVSTVLFVTHVGDRNVLVARNTYVGGVATPGTQVYTSTNPNQDNFFGRLTTGFLGAPNASIYKVLSAPYGTVHYEGTTASFNDKVVGKLDKAVPAKKDVTLANQYLVECISGSCAAGSNITIIEANQIYGQIKRG